MVDLWLPLETMPDKCEKFLVSNGVDVMVGTLIGGELYVATGFQRAADLDGRSWLGERPIMPPDRWQPGPEP